MRGDQKLTWEEQIKQEMDKRNDLCRLQGMDKVYHISVNPYQHFKNVQDLKKKPFAAKDCKLISALSHRTDKYRRYYTDLKNKKTCDRASGIWEPGTLNRSNRVDRGTCWVYNDDAHCAKNYEVDKLLRPKNMPHKKEFQPLALQSKEVCNKDPLCSWKKTTHGFDCFSKRSVGLAPDNGIARDSPPDNMPSDITKDDIAKYLYDWYVDQKHGKPPSTADLFGTGNRCTPTTSNASKNVNINNSNKRLTHEDIAKMNPLNTDHARLMIKALGKDEFFEFFKTFVYWKNKGVVFKPDFTNTPLYIASEEEIIPDEDLITSPDIMKPSIPQSIVNMVMKNIAKTSTTNRGLMAWHSTGSGKTCTAAGVMDAFWDSGKQIIFASSINAIASNPPNKFHECAYKLFPRFSKPPFQDKDEATSLERIKLAFEQRGVVFISFARLANRIVKTEKLRSILKSKFNKVGGARPKKTTTTEPTKKSTTTTKAPAKKPTTKKSLPDKKSTRKSSTTTKAPAKKSIPVEKLDMKVYPPSKAKLDSGNDSQLVKIIKTFWNISNTDAIKSATKQVNLVRPDDFIDLDNAILIIDEVHNLFRPLPNQKEKHLIVENHIVDPDRHPKLKIVILTATPGDNVTDVMKLVNIIRDPTKSTIIPPNPEDPEDVQRFKLEIRGLVSYFDMSGDTTRFPKLIDQGPIKYPMSDKQFDKYVQTYKEVKDVNKDYLALAKKNQLNKFWSGARKYSNMMYNFDKNISITEFSSKLPALLDTVAQFTQDKHYIYSAFFENRGSSQGILEIARQFERIGYTKLTVREAKLFNKNKNLPLPAKRYVLAIQSEFGDEGSASAGNNLQELTRIFNHPDNRFGNIIQLFLASQAFNEGIDLKAVKHIHIFEPLLTIASDMQTIGRARRFCSHSDLPQDHWNVNVHRYLSDLPISSNVQNKDLNITDLQNQLVTLNETLLSIKGDKTKTKIREITKNSISDINKKIKSLNKPTHNVLNIDSVIFNEAKTHFKLLFTIYNSIQASAIDCNILSNFHSINSFNSNKIVCTSLSTL